MKYCQKCRSEWPDEANFCPMDGGLLTPVVQAPQPAAVAPRAARPAAAPRPAAPAPRPAPAVGRRQAEREWAQRSQTRQMAAGGATPDARPTDPLLAAAPAAKGPRPAAAPTDPMLPLAAAPPARPAAPAGQPVAAAAPAAAAPTAAAPPGEPERRRFSETAWFLAAQSPEDLRDVEPGEDAAEESERYHVDDPLPADVRRRFSLSETVPRLKALDEPWVEDEPLPDDEPRR